MKHKIRRGLILTCILVAIIVAVYAVGHTLYLHIFYSDLEPPIIAMNFNPSGETELPTGNFTRLVDKLPDKVYTYDIQRNALRPVEISGFKWCDADMATGRVVGCAEDRVVMSNIGADTLEDLGPMEYDMTYIKLRPGTRDYSGLTGNRHLIMWSQSLKDFIDLGDYSEYNASFGYSWREDGQALYVPDEDGIAILDITTLERQHWLTLPIQYGRFPSRATNLGARCRKAFEVSQNGTSVVYCANETLILVELGPNADVLNETVLSKFDNACCFTLSPDGKSVAYAVLKHDYFLFKHCNREVWVYHNGKTKKLFEQDGELISDMRDIFW